MKVKSEGVVLQEEDVRGEEDEVRTEEPSWKALREGEFDKGKRETIYRTMYGLVRDFTGFYGNGHGRNGPY